MHGVIGNSYNSNVECITTEYNVGIGNSYNFNIGVENLYNINGKATDSYDSKATDDFTCGKTTDSHDSKATNDFTGGKATDGKVTNDFTGGRATDGKVTNANDSTVTKCDGILLNWSKFFDKINKLLKIEYYLPFLMAGLVKKFTDSKVVRN